MPFEKSIWRELLLLIQQVFENEDGSIGIQYLVTSDTTLTHQTVVTQTNHFFAALCGYIKLELLKSSTSINDFALKSKLYFSALQSAYHRLNSMQPVRLAA